MCIGLSPERPSVDVAPCYSSENESAAAATRPCPNRRLSKQMSMLEAPRDAAWEKRRRQHVLRKENGRKSNASDASSDDIITDEDLRELKGCIELGFGFKEEQGQALCNTLPALDLYFAVKRQLAPSPKSTLRRQSPWTPSPSTPPSPAGSTTSVPEPWKICSPGEDPQQVKNRLRHWAQAVACSLMQSK